MKAGKGQRGSEGAEGAEEAGSQLEDHHGGREDGEKKEEGEREETHRENSRIIRDPEKGTGGEEGGAASSAKEMERREGSF